MDNQNNRSNKNNPKNNRQGWGAFVVDTGIDTEFVFADAGERPAGDQLR